MEDKGRKPKHQKTRKNTKPKHNGTKYNGNSIVTDIQRNNMECRNLRIFQFYSFFFKPGKRQSLHCSTN